MKAMLKEKEAAEYLNISRSSLLEIRDLPVVKIGKRGKRYPVRGLDRWIESNEQCQVSLYTDKKESEKTGQNISTNTIPPASDSVERYKFSEVLEKQTNAKPNKGRRSS